MKSVIEVQGLTKYFKKTRGIEKLNFTINKQEIFGFIGPNGAGKSTTIRCMLGLISPDEGTVSIMSHDMSNSPEKILGHIGYLPSEVNYYDKLKVLDFLKYSASFYDHDCTEKMISLANRLDLDLNKKVGSLSYGNKKKVGIVQALLHSPDVIILDEPTGGLDPLIQQRFFEIILEENKRGATILLSSHVLSEVQKVCDRVAIIKEGSIIKVSDIQSLRHENYQRVILKSSTLKQENLEVLGFIKDLSISDNVFTFLYQGSSKDLIQLLVQHNVEDLYISEPSLEEIFMHYYE